MPRGPKAWAQARLNYRHCEFPVTVKISSTGLTPMGALNELELAILEGLTT